MSKGFSRRVWLTGLLGALAAWLGSGAKAGTPPASIHTNGRAAAELNRSGGLVFSTYLGGEGWATRSAGEGAA